MTHVTMKDIEAVRVRPATAIDVDTLQGYDFTRLNAVSTCPRYGVVRYIHDKAMSAGVGRAMALEAGQASHQVYAAARLWQLGVTQGMKQHMDTWGVKLFGSYNYEQMWAAVDDRESERNRYLNFCLQALYDSGFYDDPDDKRRTIANIEEALIAYLDRFDLRRNVYVHDMDDPTALVGIEIPINVVVEFDVRDGDTIRFRLIGRADGLHWHDDKLKVHENKTASRLGDAWSLSFETSHQVTGYMVGVSAIIGKQVFDAQVHGMCIPLPRSYDYGGLATENVKRTPFQVDQWAAWALDTVQIINQWRDEPLSAPMYTGSCNKYFRPCSFIPLCAARTDEEAQMVFDDMVESVWNPLGDAEDVNN